MPLYDYRCRACRRHVFRVFPVEHAPPDCPQCGQRMTQRLHPPVLRGTGYTTITKAEPDGSDPGDPESILGDAIYDD